MSQTTNGLPPAPQGGSTDAAAAMMLYDANKKSALIAYILWFFVGTFGGHRFYLRRPISALILLLITLMSFVLTFVLIGYLGFLFTALWLLLDAFLIPGMVGAENNRLIARLRQGT